MTTWRHGLWLVLGAGAILLGGCSSQPAASGSAAEQPIRPDETIMELVRADPELSKLEAALIAADLDGTLDMENEPYTLFAPTDAAFAALPEGQLDQWMRDSLDIREVMLYHILPATFSTDAFVEEQVLGVQTFQGGQVSINIESNPPRIDRAAIVRADIWARNGVIHVIDQVLTPSGY